MLVERAALGRGGPAAGEVGEPVEEEERAEEQAEPAERERDARHAREEAPLGVGEAARARRDRDGDGREHNGRQPARPAAAHERQQAEHEAAPGVRLHVRVRHVARQVHHCRPAAPAPTDAAGSAEYAYDGGFDGYSAIADG